MNTSLPTNSNRIVFLDYLRVVACFMVILVHSIEPFYLGGDGTYIASHNDALIVTLLDSLLRSAVPLFVMASSYLLVPVKADTATFYRRRAERVVIPFVVWSLLYAIVPFWGMEADVADNLKTLSLNFLPTSGHLWFVYMLLGVYLIMPIISPWLERVSARGERYFLALWLLATALPFLRLMAATMRGTEEVWGEASWNEFGALYYVSGFIGYVVAAHYIRQHIDWGVKRTLLVALPLLAVGYIATALPFYQQIPTTYPVNDTIELAVSMERSWCFATTGVALQTIALFLLFKLITKPCRIYPIFRRVAELSYGIYLIHIFVLVAAFNIISEWQLPTLTTILLTASSTFVVCIILTRLIALLPKSKYLIG